MRTKPADYLTRADGDGDVWAAAGRARYLALEITSTGQAHLGGRQRATGSQ